MPMHGSLISMSSDSFPFLDRCSGEVSFCLAFRVTLSTVHTVLVGVDIFFWISLAWGGVSVAVSGHAQPQQPPIGRGSMFYII